MATPLHSMNQLAGQADSRCSEDELIRLIKSAAPKDRLWSVTNQCPSTFYLFWSTFIGPLLAEPNIFQWMRSKFISEDKKQYRKSPYYLLSTLKNATTQQIKKQYRTLSKKYHPDLTNNLGQNEKQKAEIKMREINNAYEILKKERSIK